MSTPQEPSPQLPSAPSRQAIVAHIDGFDHLHAAHCESGVTALLFREAGAPMSEPMLFGIGSGAFFAHLSFVKVMGTPLTTFRSFPGGIFKRACTRLGASHKRETFRRPAAGMRRLDTLLAEGRRVGLQVNIYWLPYIPRQMRVHFNGHNLMVLGKRGDNYIISDPVMETPFECPAADLQRARFSGGNAALGRGLLYYATSQPSTTDLDLAVRKGLEETCNRMLRIPRAFRWFGVQGIDHLARQITKWPTSVGERRAKQWAAGVVRMQEEVGTGGAGFRYLFAAFLQEARDTLGWAELGELSEQTTAVGDEWRRFALHMSRMARGKGDRTWDQLGGMLRDIGQSERALFANIDGVRRGGPKQLSG